MNQNFFTSDLQQIMPYVRSIGAFTSTITFQQQDGTITGAGTPSGNYVNVAGLTSLGCRAAPPSTARIQATEVKALGEILQTKLLHVLLDSYYGGVAVTLATTGAVVYGPQQNWHATLDGISYEVFGVEHDSAYQMTRVTLKLATE